MKHQLNNGIVIEEVRNPAGGTSFYASAGPEGKVLVWDTAMIPVSVKHWRYNKRGAICAPFFYPRPTPAS